MKAPPSLATLTARHSKAVERFAAESSKPFTARLVWLLSQIRRELPQVGGLVCCNGDSWLIPVGYPKQESAGIPVEDDNDPHAMEALIHILDMVGSGYGARPKVSARCMEYIKEVYELALYCSDCRLHTLDPQEVLP